MLENPIESSRSKFYFGEESADFELSLLLIYSLLSQETVLSPDLRVTCSE